MERNRWYKEAIVYQVYPYSFMDGNGDGMGDIAGILSKLDYIKELGVTAIWFSPLYKTAYADYGYDVSDYRSINPDMGTMEEFDELLRECHKRNLKVIMDMVINHTSIDHPWFREALKDTSSPYRDYYLIRPGKKITHLGKTRILPPTNWNSTFTGSAWERIEGTEDYYLHLFCKEQADLNWENPRVREEIADILNFWLEKGVDGFRFDVFNMFSKVHPFQDDPTGKGGGQFFIDGPRMHEFLRELQENALGKYGAYSVGESYRPGEDETVKYVDESRQELDTIFNFAHLEADNFMKFVPRPFDLMTFKNGLFGAQRKYYDAGWNTLVLENHDNQRSVSRFGIDTDRYRYEAATFLAAITFMGFGTPFIYQGQEIGMTGMDFTSMDQMKDPVSHFVYDLLRKFKVPAKTALSLVKRSARDNARTPMQWNGSRNAGFTEGGTTWQEINPNYERINVEKDLSSGRSIYRFYQQLLKIKKEIPAAIYGKTVEFAHTHRQIIAYARVWKGETLFVAGNFSGKEARCTYPEIFKGKLEILLQNYDDKNGTGDNAVVRAENSLKGELALRPYEVIVCKVKREKPTDK